MNTNLIGSKQVASRRPPLRKEMWALLLLLFVPSAQAVYFGAPYDEMYDWVCGYNGALVFYQEGWTTNGCAPGMIRMTGAEYAIHERRIYYDHWAMQGKWQDGTILTIPWWDEDAFSSLAGSSTWSGYWRYSTPIYSDPVPIGSSGLAVIDLGSLYGIPQVWRVPYANTSGLFNNSTTAAIGNQLAGNANPAPATANIGDEINVISGNVGFEETDVDIACPGLPLIFRRRYASALAYESELGSHWVHPYSWKLSDTTTVYSTTGRTNVWKVLTTDAGNQCYFYAETNGAYLGPMEQNWTLAKTNDEYRVGMPGSVTLVFDTNGVLQRLTDGFSNRLALTYSNSLLSKVEHTAGKALTFSYESNRLTRVDTPSTNLYLLFAYNAAGELTNALRHLSSDTECVRYEYDAATNHYVTNRVDARGEAFTWEYATNGVGGLTAQGRHGAWNTNHYYEMTVDYCSTACLSTVTSVRGDTNLQWQYFYQPSFQQIEKIRRLNDSSNLVFQRVFDSAGNITRAMHWDTSIGESNSVVCAYDARHNVTNAAYGYGMEPASRWDFTWHAEFQKLTSLTDPEGRKVAWEYTNGLLAKEQVYLTSSQTLDTLFYYTTNGLLAAVTNANGHGVRYDYDSYGNPTSMVPGAGLATWFTWDELNHLTAITMPGQTGARTIALEPDEKGQVKKITWPDSVSESFGYDALGNLTNHTDRGGRSTHYAWYPDYKLGSVTRTLAGAGSTQDVSISFGYDQQLNTLQVVDELGRNAEAYVLDDLGRVKQVTNIDTQQMTIAWGLSSYINSALRYDGTAVSNEYDQAGLLSRVAFPGTTNSFRWRRNGLLQSASNEQGAISLAYDGANRLTQASNAAPNGVVHYGYNPAGNVSNMVSVAGTNSYAYDAAERMVSVSNSAGLFGLTYTEANGLLLVPAVAVTNRIHVEYSHDAALERLTSIAWRDRTNGLLRSFGYTYDAAGRIVTVNYESGERVEYAYDSLDRLTGETRYDGQTQVLSTASWAYDLAGNRTNKMVNGVGLCYTLGNGNRLTNWAVVTTGLLGRLDVAGCANESIGTDNRFGYLWVSPSTGSGQATNGITPSVRGTNFWTHDARVAPGDQQIVAAVRDMAGNMTHVTNSVFLSIVTNGSYLLDDAGNVTNIAYSGGDCQPSRNLIWDGAYRLSEARTNGVAVERNGYDALGRRAWTAASDAEQAWETNYLVYDGAQVVADVDATGGLQRSYVWGPGIDNLLAMTVHTGTTAKTYYALRDHLGTVHALVDTNGVIAESYRFDAWGKVLGVYDSSGVPIANRQSAIGNRYLWQGREYSWKSSLYYFRARWYDPVTGRFISNDPIGISGGLNQYVFCGNNGVNLVDPFGTCSGNINKNALLQAANNTSKVNTGVGVVGVILLFTPLAPAGALVVATTGVIGVGLGATQTGLTGNPGPVLWSVGGLVAGGGAGRLALKITGASAVHYSFEAERYYQAGRRGALAAQEAIPILRTEKVVDFLTSTAVEKTGEAVSP